MCTNFCYKSLNRTSFQIIYFLQLQSKSQVVVVCSFTHFPLWSYARHTIVEHMQPGSFWIPLLSFIILILIFFENFAIMLLSWSAIDFPSFEICNFSVFEFNVFFLQHSIQSLLVVLPSLVQIQLLQLVAFAFKKIAASKTNIIFILSFIFQHPSFFVFYNILYYFLN